MLGTGMQGMLTVSGCEQKMRANGEMAEALAYEKEQEVDMGWPGREFYEEYEEETEEDEEEDDAWDELDVADINVQTFATIQKKIAITMFSWASS